MINEDTDEDVVYTRRLNPHNRSHCSYCGGNRVDYRVTTKDLRCKDCGKFTPVHKLIQ